MSAVRGLFPNLVGLIVGGAEQVEGQARRSLRPDSGEPLQAVHQPIDGR